MSPLDFEVSFYAATVWRLARSSNEDELTAVACVIRNHVVPRLGQITVYKSFYEACQDFMKVYPIRDLPSLSDPAFVAQGAILDKINKIYTCEHEDVTATHDHPYGAKYFSSAPDEWFKAEIIGQPEKHPLIGNFGSMQFFA